MMKLKVLGYKMLKTVSYAKFNIFGNKYLEKLPTYKNCKIQFDSRLHLMLKCERQNATIVPK